MKKIILICVIIGLVCVLIGLFLTAGPVREKPTEKSAIPQLQEIHQVQEISQIQEIQVPKNTTSTSQIVPTLGIYEVCSDLSECNPEMGIEKIKTTGAEAVIVTVVDEEDSKSVSYYPSKYLPMAEGIPSNYLERIVELAHKNGIKVYASINMPHNYWLARHPDWIAVWSNGQPADTYERDYFHQIVPPSRVIAEEECQELLKNIIGEVISYDVDGIDINDNFQFSDQYLEETDTTLYFSFDDFTIKKFEEDINVAVQGNSPKEQAKYIESHPDIYLSWLNWRAEQVTQLIKILKQDIKNTGLDIPLRPHLLTHGDPYEYYGLDYQRIAKEADALYLMITPDQSKEKYFEIIKGCQDIQTKRIVASTYLYIELGSPTIERNEEKILERMKWIIEAGTDEIYVYNFRLIEEGNLWMTTKSVFEKIKVIKGA